MQTASIVLCSEMETEACCEEYKDSSVEPEMPDVKQATSERDGHTELPCGSVEEGNELFVSGEPGTESCAGESKCTEIKQPSESEPQSGGTVCPEKRKMKKTNSWKIVRFQEPSMDDDVLEIDSSAENLFPEYVIKEWTSSTFEELFMAEEWQDITGEDARVNTIDVISLLASLTSQQGFSTI